MENENAGELIRKNQKNLSFENDYQMGAHRQLKVSL